MHRYASIYIWTDMHIIFSSIIRTPEVTVRMDLDGIALRTSYEHVLGEGRMSLNPCCLTSMRDGIEKTKRTDKMESFPRLFQTLYLLVSTFL